MYIYICVYIYIYTYIYIYIYIYVYAHRYMFAPIHNALVSCVCHAQWQLEYAHTYICI